MSNHKPFNKQTLAEQVAARIEESIVSGAISGGDILPTEVEMSEQFDVSRAVVRDATRMLAAKGLIEVRHGKGSYVTHTQIKAFGEALLLALRRMDASNWDVAQFEQLLFPEILALAAQNATDEDISQIETGAKRYLSLHAKTARMGLPPEKYPEYDKLKKSWADFVQAVFDATHNKVIQLLAQPLIQLHGPRDWKGLPNNITDEETRFSMTVIDLIKARDPNRAREQMRRLLELPPEAVKALKKSAIATSTTIILDAKKE